MFIKFQLSCVIKYPNIFKRDILSIFQIHFYQLMHKMVFFLAWFWDTFNLVNFKDKKEVQVYRVTKELGKTYLTTNDFLLLKANHNDPQNIYHYFQKKLLYIGVISKKFWCFSRVSKLFIMIILSLNFLFDLYKHHFKKRKNQNTVLKYRRDI